MDRDTVRRTTGKNGKAKNFGYLYNQPLPISHLHV